MNIVHGNLFNDNLFMMIDHNQKREKRKTSGEQMKKKGVMEGNENGERKSQQTCFK